MREFKLVSVVIPNYNHSKYLRDRLDSVINQSYPNLEIIILDDASTDNSHELISRYLNLDERIKYYPSNDNSGSTFKQWAKGIAIATGDLIWIAESDDIADLNFVKCAVTELSESDVLYFGESEKIDRNGDSLGLVHIDDIWTKDFRMEGYRMISEYFAYNNYVINASSAIFRRDAALEVSALYKEYTFCGDWQFWIEIIAQGNVYHSKKVINKYRIHDVNVTSKSLKEGLYIIEGLKVTNYLRSKRIAVNNTRILEKWHNYLWCKLFESGCYNFSEKIKLFLKLIHLSPNFVSFTLRRKWLH